MFGRCFMQRCVATAGSQPRIGSFMGVSGDIAAGCILSWRPLPVAVRRRDRRGRRRPLVASRDMVGKGARRADRGADGSQPAALRFRNGAVAVGSVVNRHRRDIWSLAAIVAGLMVAGSVWFSAAGPVGEQVDRVLGAGFGLVSAALPVGLSALGVASLCGGRRRGAADRGGDGDDDSAGDDPAADIGQFEGSDSATRLMLGGALLLVSSTGLLHVSRGRPGLGATVDELGAAGGVLGVGVGGFLHAWTALWGSTLLLVFVGLVGLMFVTQLTVRSAVGASLAVLRPPLRVLRSAVVNLFSDIKDVVPAGPATADLPGDGHPDAAARNAGDGSVRVDASVALSQAAPALAPRAKISQPAPAPASARARALRLGASAKERKQPSKWKLPPIDLLAASPSREIDKIEVVERGQLLQATLARFEVPTIMLEPVVGPTVTRFVLELGEGVRVAKLESLRKDIALSMASPDVRILSPIPGRRAIGVEVPNLDRQIVRLGDVLRSAEAAGAEHPLEVAVGRDINGHAIMVNLATTPHLLIAGATGAGKSSCLNSLITSVLMRSDPDAVKMILVDPKRVEMGQYARVPHLLTAPVTDPRKAANALGWAVKEMDRRYDLLHDTGFRDITGYNSAVDADTVDAPSGVRRSAREPLRYQRLPFVLVAVDELADLMMVAARDVEESIARIAQMARAVGIHLVIATQRPSVNIITGVIKANIPARLAFAVSSLTDSRVILDHAGAERLLGQGDMLWLGPSSSTPHRIQGCWVTEDEVRAVVAHWMGQAPNLTDDPSVLAPGLGGAPTMSASITAAPPVQADHGDELLDAAMALVLQTQLGSTSMLQRRLRVGFSRAGRIMDLLEQRGVVGPSIGSKAREVLITADEHENSQAD